MPGYEPTPVVPCPGLAAELGLRSLHVKDEAGRFGTRSFKILGCVWAVAVTLHRLADGDGVPDPGQLAALGAGLAEGGRYLLAASAGNHGSALARVAAWCGLPCRVLLPQATPPGVVTMIAEEAEVQLVTGGYDDAVLAARLLAQNDERALLVSDTSWQGYETLPSLVIEGYATLFGELEDTGLTFDLIIVQIGVGALAAAAVRHFRREGQHASILAVEPSRAACALASTVKGAVSRLPQVPGSVMTGLDCGTPSHVAWPYLARGIDAFAAVDDDEAVTAEKLLAGTGLRTRPSGAAGIAGLRRTCKDKSAREQLGLSAATRALAIVTEGAPPEVYGGHGRLPAQDGSTG